MQTARALSEMRPEYIGLLTLLFELPTPLMRDWQEGRFRLMNPVEIAAETLVLLENIDSEGLPGALKPVLTTGIGDYG